MTLINTNATALRAVCHAARTLTRQLIMRRFLTTSFIALALVIGAAGVAPAAHGLSAHQVN